MTDRIETNPTGAVRRMPMFPLGSVLFPELGLPLRIFEPRYVRMLQECVADEGEFGVVLIERGSEVGGGEVRLRVATTARILDVQPQDDGTYGVFCVGTGRVEVIEWLPDAPYPVAVVADYDDVPDEVLDSDSDNDSGEDYEGVVNDVIRRLRSTLARRSEANLAAAPATIELSPDWEVALWQACGLVPATPLDDYELLATRSVRDRIAALDALIVTSNDHVRFHMS